MKTGTLYGIGVGPGDPDLITVKGATILGKCRHVFVPRAKIKSESLALIIANRYIDKTAQVHELVFPMTKDGVELARRWKENGQAVADVLKGGDDAVFLTLGDLFLYSTYIYLLREVKKLIPDVDVVSVPGVTSFSLASALTAFPIGEGREPVTIIPAAVTDLDYIRRAITGSGTVVLMKIDKKLPQIITVMDELGVIDDAVMVSRAGLEGECIETNLRKLKEAPPETGYFSVILIHNTKGAQS